MPHDFVIIGSGFGGAVSACRLAARGDDVLVLERGREWHPDDYPRDEDDAWIWDSDEPHEQNGWIDLRILDQMWVAQGAGVGGGSLIYANVSINAPPEAFDDGWPSAISAEELAPYYDKVAAMLRPAPIPDGQLTSRFKLMREAADAAGVGDRFRKVDLAVTFDDSWSYDLEDPTNEKHSKKWTNAQGIEQGTCIHCGNCDIGCSVRAKNTLDLNYLAAARTSGAKIQTLSLVSHVESLDGIWRVHYENLAGGERVKNHVDAKRVILAAGSLGSTEILLRSRDQYRTLPNLAPALGRSWSSNGDFLTPAIYEGRDVSPTMGPTITAAIDFLRDGKDGARFFVEDGGFPNLLGNFVTAKLKGKTPWFMRRLLKRLQKGFAADPFKHVMPWFGQAIDGGDGRLYLGRNWLLPWQRKLKMDWNPERSKLGVNGLIAMHKELSDATGGKVMDVPSWKIFANLVTPHPLGGCNMSLGPGTGVVNDRGEVFGYAGLYVLDGSIVPRPIGLNPSKTIAALAERACDLMD